MKLYRVETYTIVAADSDDEAIRFAQENGDIFECYREDMVATAVDEVPEPWLESIPYGSHSNVGNCTCEQILAATKLEGRGRKR